MKKILITLFITSFSLSTIAQKTLVQDTSCSFLKDLKFKNGVDTIELQATYDAFLKGSDEPFLRILANQKQLRYSEYVDQGASSSLSFLPSNCNKLYQATLSRKIYDKTFVKKTNNIGEYMKDIVAVGSLKSGQTIFLKCIVFEDKKVYFGKYFFIIIDMRIVDN